MSISHRKREAHPTKVPMDDTLAVEVFQTRRGFIKLERDTQSAAKTNSWVGKAFALVGILQ